VNEDLILAIGLMAGIPLDIEVMRQTEKKNLELIHKEYMKLLAEKEKQ
jgi:hypothetical protein